jgi:hypothetical protein
VLKKKDYMEKHSALKNEFNSNEASSNVNNSHPMKGKEPVTFFSPISFLIMTITCSLQKGKYC